MPLPIPRDALSDMEGVCREPSPPVGDVQESLSIIWGCELDGASDPDCGVNTGQAVLAMPECEPSYEYTSSNWSDSWLAEGTERALTGNPT